MSEALAQYGDGATSDLAVSRPPEKILDEARRVASMLKAVIEQTKGSIKLGASEHLKIEAWSTLAQFYGCTPRVTRTQFVDYGNGVQGFEAYAELVHVATGRVVSTAEAMCLTDEPQWRERAVYEWRDNARVAVGQEPVPLFQLRSMAQTRAVSKVCATALRWVVVLAGYSGIPAEEMAGRESAAFAAPAMTPPRRKGEPEPEPEPGESVTLTGTVADISTKSGVSRNGRPWQLWRIELSNGKTFNTFSDTLAKRAESLRVSGQQAEFLCKVSARGGYDLKDIVEVAGTSAPQLEKPEQGSDDDLGF